MTGAAAVWREAPPAGWNDLLAGDPNATPAHRPELWEALAGILPGHAVRFAALEEGGELVGGAAVLIERRAGLHWIHALPMALPGAPLARPGRHADVDRAVASALEDLRCELRAAGGEWSLYRPRGPAVAAEAYEIVPGDSLQIESAIVELGGGAPGPGAGPAAAAWRRVDRKTRQDIQRARERGLEFAEDAAALDPAWALHAAQASRWSAVTPLPLELSRRLIELGAARLFTVRDPRGLLSAAFALDHPRETLVWWSGTHPDGRAEHAFALLLWSIVEWAAGAGRERVNLGASPGLDPVAAFKRSLGAAPVAYPVRWIDSGEAPIVGQVVAAAQRWLRRGRLGRVPSEAEPAR